PCCGGRSTRAGHCPRAGRSARTCGPARMSARSEDAELAGAGFEPLPLLLGEVARDGHLDLHVEVARPLRRLDALAAEAEALAGLSAGWDRHLDGPAVG